MSNDEKNIERIFDKLDVVNEKIASIDKTLIMQHGSLEIHIRRTEALEKITDIIISDLKPVKTHVSHVEGAFKFLGLISLLVGIVAGILKIVGVI